MVAHGTVSTTVDNAKVKTIVDSPCTTMVSSECLAHVDELELAGPCTIMDLPSDCLAHVLHSLLASEICGDAATAAVRLNEVSFAFWRTVLRSGQIFRRALHLRWPATSGVVTCDYRRLWLTMLRKDDGSDVAAHSALDSLQAFVTVSRGPLSELLLARGSRRKRRVATLLEQTLAGASHQPVAYRADAHDEAEPRPVGLEWHGLRLACYMAGPAEWDADSGTELVRRVHDRARAAAAHTMAVSLCFFRPCDGKVLQLPEARLHVPPTSTSIRTPDDALYFEPVDLASFPRAADPLYTPLAHIVKLRLRPTVDADRGRGERRGGGTRVVWSLAVLVAKVADADADVDAHPFERGIDLSTREERASYEDEAVGTLAEVLDVARWT